MIAWLRTPRPVLPLVVVLVLGACGGPAASGTSSAASSDVPSSAASAPTGTGPIDAGPVTVEPPAIDVADDPRLALARLEADERARVRIQAGFPGEVGSGWKPLAASADDAIDAAVRAVATQLGIDVPIANRDGRLASIVVPRPAERPAPGSAASAMAMVTAAMTAGRALGKGGTNEASGRETRTITDGDDVATVTASMKGTVTSTGSRVVAEFTFDLTGDVRNTVTGGTAHMSGTATAHVEIDGCPDRSGSSKGKMSLSSRESVSGQRGGVEGSASWTRDLSGDFDIAVNDEASISGLVLNAKAQESVQESTRNDGDGEAETHGHELGITGHYEYASGPGFTGLTYEDAKTVGDVTNQKDATKADLAPLFRSAAWAISAAAIELGTAAEKFWRDGKCVEVMVDPAGGEVARDSKTSVTAKVRHKFEAGELDKPVEASLTGVKSIEPASQKVPAPATFTYTAGSTQGDAGEVTFKSVSNRGIGETKVTFTVVDRTLKVGMNGKMTTSGFGVAYVTTIAVPKIVLSQQGDGTYLGSGPVTTTILFDIDQCRIPYKSTGTIKLRATREEVADPSLPWHWTVSWDPSGVLTTKGQCLGVDLGTLTGTGEAGPTAGFMFVLGDVVFDQDGGTKHVQLTKATGPVQNIIDATVTAEIVSDSKP
jgi:hypothetical protein